MKIFNKQTGFYKIDIYVNGVYACSTDWSKTCKAAKERFKQANKLKETDKIQAFFSKK